MSDYKTIIVKIEDGVGNVWLNRPEKRNAFNLLMLRELLEAFKLFDHDEQVRMVVLRGMGSAFCAGADLNWMKEGIGKSLEENYNECLELFDCFDAIYTCSKPTVCLVQGAVIGGANGLAASCDVTLAEPHTTFSLSEVRIGLIPSCIAPFILKRVGEFKTRELMLTGRRINEEEALSVGLINKVCEENQSEDILISLIHDLSCAGPEALKHCKSLIYDLSNHKSYGEARAYTAKKIADIRKSNEGQEGMKSFLERRRPNWTLSH